MAAKIELPVNRNTFHCEGSVDALHKDKLQLAGMSLVCEGGFNIAHDD